MTSSAPIDPTSAASLAESGLRYDLVDVTDTPSFEAWMRADMRGFHSAAPTPEELAALLTGVSYRRTTAVWDDEAVVATVSSWETPLTVPGERTVPAWAISSVTVSPTHRRKGIARNMLEGELRTASELGIPLAALTVSESTIYGRFGFAPAVFATKLTIDTRRAGWAGPTPTGRVRFITLQEFRREIESMHDRVSTTSPGQVPAWPMRWDRLSGLTIDEPERTKRVLAVRYDDAEGNLTGLATYRVTGDDDFVGHSLFIDYLATSTPDAYAGLWRYMLEVDLVRSVSADVRSADEPVLWQLADRRAAKLESWDHLWLRILDVPTALQARSYAVDGRWVFEVTDPLEFAAGRYALEVIDGVGTVARTDEPAAATLTVNALSALYPGGIAATTLAQAGLIAEATPGAAAALDSAFHSPVTPWLSIWF
jgi:predicted acetyltransferase